jgi:tetratricopeptide (TPR) repeat protein
MMTPNHEAKELFNQGMGQFVNAHYDKSIELFSGALEREPDFKPALVGRGSALLKLDRLNEARADFDRAIAGDPSYARAFHLRGLVNEKLGDDAAALKDFNRAVDLDAEYGAAYYSRSALHAKLADEDRALEDMQMATHLGSLNLERYMNTDNVWQTQHLRVEAALESELER